MNNRNLSAVTNSAFRSYTSLLIITFVMSLEYNTIRGISSPELLPSFGEVTEPLSFRDQVALILQGWSAKEIWELLEELPQETLVSLHSRLDAAVGVHKNEFLPNDHFSPASDSTGGMINPGGQAGTVAVGGDVNNGGHNMAAGAMLDNVFMGNADPSSDSDSDHDESQDSDSSSEDEEVAADNEEQGKRSKYSFVKDEKKVILHRYIKKRAELRRKGMRGTVKEVAPRVFKDIYKRGHQLGDERVQAVLQRIEEAIERNPMRKRPNVKVIINVIYNRTHNKNGSM